MKLRKNPVPAGIEYLDEEETVITEIHAEIDGPGKILMRSLPNCQTDVDVSYCHREHAIRRRDIQIETSSP